MTTPQAAAIPDFATQFLEWREGRITSWKEWLDEKGTTPEMYAMFKADLAKYHAQALARARAEVWTQAANLIPTTWLDPLLTGQKKIGEPPYSCTDIEYLLDHLRQRMLEQQASDAEGGA